MSGTDVPAVCWVGGVLFLVFVVAIVGHGVRDDRRWRNAIDSHHARTGVFPTMGDLTRPRRRAVLPVPVMAPVEADPDAVRWWLLGCPACDLSVDLAGTAAEIDAAVDWHNRTHHGTTTARLTTVTASTDDRGTGWAA